MSRFPGNGYFYYNVAKKEFSSVVVIISVLFYLVFNCSPLNAKTTIVNFDAAMSALHFDVTGDANGVNGGNSIPEGVEMAFLAALLKDNNLNLSSNHGIDHKRVYLAYQQALSSARKDLSKLLNTWPTSAQVIAAYTLLGKHSFNAINRMTTGFGAPLKGSYDQALALDNFLSAEGDADGDGFSNRQEYHAHKSESVESYIQAALNPNDTPSKEQLSDLAPPEKTRLNVGIVLYPGFEVLDVYGPLEMWAYIPDFNIVFIAEKAEPIPSAQGAATLATHTFETAPALDILMVPGGLGTRNELENSALINYIKSADKNTLYTTSVCTGSALLAKAGVLDGHRATTNKRFFFFAEQQSKNVEWVVNARWVESGKVFTSSGVSAGTDMALGLIATLYDQKTARKLASSLEYEWHEGANEDPFAPYVNRLLASHSGEYKLIKTQPQANTSIAASPKFLRLYFSDDPQVNGSLIKLYPKGGQSHSVPLLGMHSMGANDLMIAVSETLSAGDYVVEWDVGFANDATNRSGSFTFSVNADLK